MLLRAHRPHLAASRRPRTRRRVSGRACCSPLSRSRTSRSVARASRAGRESTGASMRADRWVVLGPNGSGKTTLLTGGFGPVVADRGTVEILGPALAVSTSRTLRPRVASGERLGARGNCGPTRPRRDVVASGRYGALETWWNRYETEELGEGRPACWPGAASGRSGTDPSGSSPRASDSRSCWRGR